MSIRKLYAAMIGLMLCAVVLPAQNFSRYSLKELLAEARDETSENHAAAQNAVGYRYGMGTGGASLNYKKAFKWYGRAARNNNGDAMYNLGMCYHHGVGITKDPAQALRWLEKAADSHVGVASFIVGKRYLLGPVARRDYEKAAGYLKDAAFSKDDVNGEAKYYYALCLAYGYGVQKDSTKAVLWASRAIDNGWYEAYNMLGRMYCSDQSAVEKDGAMARYFYELGDEHNVASCQNNLGYMYETGDMIDRNVNMALVYYTRAAINRDRYGMANLARLYSQADSSYYDADEAAYWFEELVNEGYDKYVEDLARIYVDYEDYDLLAEMYNSLVAKKNPEGFKGLAFMYAEGYMGAPNYRKALEYIDKAISLAPKQPDYQDYKGEILLLKGDDKGARKIWQHVRKKYPQYYEASDLGVKD